MMLRELQPLSGNFRSTTVAQRLLISVYSRSPKNPALQQLQKSSKSASTTPQRPIWNSLATVGVRDFWENGCMTPQYGRLPIVGGVGAVNVPASVYSTECII